MIEQERKDPYSGSFRETWASWGSTVGPGMFFVLSAAAVDLARLTFK